MRMHSPSDGAERPGASDFAARSEAPPAGRGHVIIECVDRAEVEAEFAHLDDVVLFDVMWETANRLRGRLIALERQAEESGDAAAAARYRDRRIDVNRERNALGARDRAAQGLAMLAWIEERNALPTADY